MFAQKLRVQPVAEVTHLEGHLFWFWTSVAILPEFNLWIHACLLNSRSRMESYLDYYFFFLDLILTYKITQVISSRKITIPLILLRFGLWLYVTWWESNVYLLDPGNYLALVQHDEIRVLIWTLYQTQHTIFQNWSNLRDSVFPSCLRLLRWSWRKFRTCKGVEYACVILYVRAILKTDVNTWLKSRFTLSLLFLSS